ncbi:MAG: N-acetylmuramoyl-L-alanine amidase [Firmicutes bacterium]|nr:N-acetylmuramoyl-L-alanine amidase [Bacillota bacterium]
MRQGVLRHLMMILLMSFIIAGGMVTVYAEEQGPTLMLDGSVLETPDPPVIRNGRTLLPAKILFETMGGTVTWDNDLRQTTIELNDTVVQLRIDNPTALVDGVEMTMDVPPTIINSRTYVPVNFAATNLGCEVLWDAVNRIVTVNSPVKDVNISVIEVLEAGNTIRVQLPANDVIRNFRVVAFENPDRIVIDVRDAKLLFNGGAGGGLGISNDIFSNVRYSQFDADIVRAVVDLSVQQAPHVSLSQDKMTLYVDFTTDGEEPYGFEENLTDPDEDEDEDIDSEVPEDEEEEEPADDDEEEIVDDLESLELPELDWRMQGKLIVIDPGHGGVDSGSLAYDGEGKRDENIILMEKEKNLEVALRLNELLKLAGATTYMTRTDDTGLGIYERPEIANDLSAALFVSVHNNSNDSETPHGTEVHYAVKESEADHGFTSKAIATAVMDELEASMGLQRRGAKNSPSYVVLRCTEMPAIIIEGAFISNPSDLEYMMSDSFVNDYALGAARGIVKALNAAAEAQE